MASGWAELMMIMIISYYSRSSCSVYRDHRTLGGESDSYYDDTLCIRAWLVYLLGVPGTTSRRRMEDSSVRSSIPDLGLL